MTAVDAVVVGQGLAGTAVTWALRWRGQRVVVVDRETSVSASRIAAGLITPITGQRLTKSWRLDELWPVAQAFYRRAEEETGTTFFHPTPAVRLLTDADELAEFQQRAVTHFPNLVCQPDPPVNAAEFAAPFGGFQMAPAARLDVVKYLDASRRHFASDGGSIAASVEPRDIEVAAEGVCLAGIRARWVVFCQGYAAAANPWTSGIRFSPVQGEILTLHIRGLAESRVIHRGVWLAPQGDGVFLAGSTFDRDRLDGIPTSRGRDEICTRLRRFLRLPFEVIDHRAAVRPAVIGIEPACGLHPDYPRVAYLNGLGSKGSLQAPYFAEQLASRLMSLPGRERVNGSATGR